MRMKFNTLVGTHIHPATGDAARRQQYAMNKLRCISSTTPVNLQFADRANLQTFEGFETFDVLKQDSCTVTKRPGIRKPLVNELFTELARVAIARELSYFCFANSDIIFTSAALERVKQGDRKAYVFARSDFEGESREISRPLIYGTDAFAVDAEWWMANCSRFRPYVVGESCWDNVYTAQLLCWADGLLLNREPLILHEVHPVIWRESPFAHHNGFLAALDRIYFTRWAVYVDHLERLRGKANGLAEEDAEAKLQDWVFNQWTPSITARLIQALRVAKLRISVRRSK